MKNYNLDKVITEYKKILSNLSIYNVNYELYKATLFLLIDYRDKINKE